MKRHRTRKDTPEAWNPDDMLTRCAWCLKKIPDDVEVSGISVRLHPAAFQEVDPGTVQRMYLPGPGKTVPMIIVAEDSPAKRRGKDAMFQICSDACGELLQQALREALEAEQQKPGKG